MYKNFEENAKLITILTPCYNEEGNVEELFFKIKNIMENTPYNYEHLFIDNNSSDNTVLILRKISSNYPNLKIIINTRNFGHIRSPYYGLLQANGDAVISIASDFQDPPELIPKFIEKWEEGYKLAIGVKTTSKEPKPLFFLRKTFYRILRTISDVPLIDNFTGFGLYDQSVIKILRNLNDPYPYFRGLIAEIGIEYIKIEYTQPIRKKGVTKNNFYTLYDMAMLGLTNYSKAPLRLATMLGFFIAIISFVVGLGYLIYKLLFWKEFSLGLAPVIIGIFFSGSVQLLFLGIVGEYIGAIYTKLTNHPLVIEKERINFD